LVVQFLSWVLYIDWFGYNEWRSNQFFFLSWGTFHNSVGLCYKQYSTYRHLDSFSMSYESQRLSPSYNHIELNPPSVEFVENIETILCLSYEDDLNSSNFDIGILSELMSSSVESLELHKYLEMNQSLKCIYCRSSVLTSLKNTCQGVSYVKCCSV